MAETRLVAEAGRPTGSAASRRLRRAGRIPAVVYGHGMEPLPVSVGARDLRAALAHGVNQLLTLEVGGKSHMVLARQLQRHPVRRSVSHVDFQVVRGDEVVTVEVPIIAVGQASEVEREGGILEHPMSTLTVRSTPGRIPEHVTVDLGKLEPGGALRVRDIALPAGVTTEVDPDEPVVVASMPTALAAEEAEVAEAAPEAGPAREPGAAPAPGAGTAGPARTSEGGAAGEA